jgi:hypothetical protein
MDFRPSDEQELLRKSVREFAEAEIRPHVMEWDEAQQFPMDLLPKLAAIGLTGIQFEERFGGSAMSAVDYCICIEELARVCPAIALSVAAHNGLCSSHINMFGSEAQKAHYLPRLVTGETLGAWGLTEAGAGSDAAACRRRRASRATTGSSTARRLHHPRRHRRRDGRHGVTIDRRATAASRRSCSSTARRHGAGQEREQARDARERHERGDLRDCRCRARRCSARRDRASSTRCRCSTPGRIGIAALSVGPRAGRV